MSLEPSSVELNPHGHLIDTAASRVSYSTSLLIQVGNTPCGRVKRLPTTFLCNFRELDEGELISAGLVRKKFLGRRKYRYFLARSFVKL